MASLIQIAQGQNTVAIAASQPQSLLISAQVGNDNITNISVTTDDKGNNWSTGNVSYISTFPGNSQAEINYSFVAPGGGQHPPLSGVTLVTGSVGGPGPTYMWVFEIGEPTFTTDPVSGPCFSVTPQDSQVLGSAGPIPSSANPSLDATGIPCADFFGISLGCPDWDFVVAICAAGGDGGNVTGVQAPWIMAGTPQGGNVCAYRFMPKGSKPCPLVFNASAPTISCITVSGFYSFAPTITPGSIVVTKNTNPPGSPQIFTFHPSWEAPFTLTDGQSQTTVGLAPGTYSISEDAVAGFTTTTNVDPTNVVLSSGQTINVLFTNTQLQPPCIPPDGSTTGTFVPDVGLFIGPSTSLYKDPVLASDIKTYERTLEGRHEIVLDFSNGDGLYARDLGTIFSWSIETKTTLYVWQPSILPMPETIYGRPSDWDDGGTPGAKFIQGIILEADSFGVSKTFQLENQDDHSFHNLLETPTIFTQKQEKAFSCFPFISHAIRLMSSDGVRWRVWNGRLIYQPLPELTENWQTEMTSLGMIGWVHAREMNIPHISTADITLTLTFDGWPSINLTIPNSGGLQAKTKITLPPNKWKLIGLRALSAQPFRLFEGDLELKVKPWGSTESYNVLRPFGGPSQPGATV